METTVRADFYADGSIVPIGITYPNGHSKFINTIVQTYQNLSANGKIEYHFLCCAGKDTFWLAFSDGKWLLQPNI